jgi:hypothetical protein
MVFLACWRQDANTAVAKFEDSLRDVAFLGADFDAVQSLDLMRTSSMTSEAWRIPPPAIRFAQVRRRKCVPASRAALR